MYVLEFFNHPAAKGETVFSGTKENALRFLAHEANTLLTPVMQARADEMRHYITFIPVPAEDIIWGLNDAGDSSAYYVFSKCKGKRAKELADV